VSSEPRPAQSRDCRSRGGGFRLNIALIGLPFILAAPPPAPAAQLDNNLPEAVVAALENPQTATLYSIEPGRVSEFDMDFHHYEVLGKSRIGGDEARRVLADLRESLSRPNGGPAMCFQPHHRISVHSGAHTYDLVICYLCGGLRIYRDDSFIAGLLLAGTPKVLNELAVKHGLPKPQILVRDELQRQEMERAAAHWLTVMPASVRPLWPEFLARHGPADYRPLEVALAQEFPEERQRILVLFAWYASGTGRWSGYPADEEIVADLLHRYPFAELSQVAQSDALTDLQLKGAARFFAGWILGHQESDDRRVLTQGLTDYFRATDNWVAEMPASIRPLWKDALWYEAHVDDTDRDRMTAALNQQFTDRNQLILALLSWYGSGIGVECQCARYEYVALDLLFKYSTADLVAAAQSQPLTEKQLDGAARFLAHWYFQRERPHEIEGFPQPLKAALLAHIHSRGYSEWEKYSAPFK
jgi:hypothetical protein